MVAVDQRARGVRRQVAEVLGVPERELLDGAVLDVVAHLVRRAEPGQRDLALRVRGRQVAGRSGDADRGGRDDALQVRVLLQQRRGLVERRLVVVVAVDRPSTSLMFGWLAASSFFISSIQAFWLVALAAADRIAISPESPISSAIMSTCTAIRAFASANFIYFDD